MHNTKPITECETYCQCFGLIQFLLPLLLQMLKLWQFHGSCFTLDTCMEYFTKRMFLFKCRFARMMRKNCMCIELELGLHFERSNQSIAESIPNTVQSEEMLNIYILFPKMFTIKWTEFSSCPIIFSMVVMRCVWVVLYPQKCGCFEQFVRIKLTKTKFHRDFSRNLFRLFSLFSMKKHASSCKENSWVREKTCD